ncbi:helix-turn-helix domain-containing protein [Bacillus massiliglaciei]|uniref:helix-turn-helix domain-containing protein n=1 Tax=Bacillus massiliglaciei TaxID=1816693 RepID=UPI0018FEE090|nr:helix-turn-helix domain-containing protein [Bacillus massiliglaciei]
MVKYDEGFKQKVVDAYLAGEGGYASLAIRFGIRSKTNIRKWVSVFQQFSKQGLAPKKAITNYPVQFKLDVLNYKVRTGDSLEEVERINAKLTGISPVEYRLYTSQRAA